MKEKRKSYRERYFEDYEATRVAANTRRGWRTEYRYIGRFCAWEAEGGRLSVSRGRMAVAEIFSVAIYLAALLAGTPFGSVRLANGFGVLSLVPWLLELSGVLRFLFAAAYVRELSCEEIGRSIRSGAVLRALLLALSVLAGGIGLLRASAFTVQDVPVVLAVLASACLSCLVKREYDRLLVISYGNKNGQPGERL